MHARGYGWGMQPPLMCSSIIILVSVLELVSYSCGGCWLLEFLVFSEFAFFLLGFFGEKTKRLFCSLREVSLQDLGHNAHQVTALAIWLSVAYQLMHWHSTNVAGLKSPIPFFFLVVMGQTGHDFNLVILSTAPRKTGSNKKKKIVDYYPSAYLA